MKSFAIENAQIKNLSEKQLVNLGAEMHGIDFYAGKPRRNVKGFKRVFESADEIHFVKDSIRYEIVKTADTYDDIWGVRKFNLITNEYDYRDDNSCFGVVFIQLKVTRK